MPSTPRLISRRDPAVLGPYVAVGDRALGEPGGENAGPFQQFRCWDGGDELPTAYV
jgi:hypothetical protein